jgi:hypothetical protein
MGHYTVIAKTVDDGLQLALEIKESLAASLCPEQRSMRHALDSAHSM